MIRKAEWRWAAVWAMGLVALASLPYLVAYLATPDGMFYTGFLTNPEDGHSYLSKVRQGMQGAWLWHLAFTATPHGGAFLFTYYLALGHLARWVGVGPIWIIHFARVVNGCLLLFALYYAVSWLFDDLVRRRFAFLLAAVGSGLGWLLMLLGLMTVDLWVPEGYVFYSMFANAHFPLAMASMICLLIWSVTPWNATRIEPRRIIWVVLGTAVLGFVQPFCLLTVALTLLVYATWLWVQWKRLPQNQIVAAMVIGVVGLPFAVNAYLGANQDATMAASWLQNQAPSPPPWDYAIGYGLVLVLALPGIWRTLCQRDKPSMLLMCWALSTTVLLYVPLGLQRRLVMGLVVPLAGLAATGWHTLSPRRRPSPAIVFGTAGLTHLVLVAMSILVAFGGHSLLYMSADEEAAMQWLGNEVPQNALVAAAPETGLFIPAWAGQRVFYGHPYETADAEQREAEVGAFFADGDLSILPYRPDYVFYGERERALQAVEWSPDDRWRAVYENRTVTVYAVPKEVG
jgi:hypothetical protein